MVLFSFFFGSGPKSQSEPEQLVLLSFCVPLTKRCVDVAEGGQGSEFCDGASRDED